MTTMNDKLNEVLNRAKAAAFTAGAAAGKGIDAAKSKGSEIAQSAKLSKKAFDLESDVDGLMQSIGKLVYDTHKGLEPSEGELEELLYEVDGKLAELEAVKEEMNGLKNAKTCPICGKTVSRDDSFCKSCGSSLD